MTASTRDGRPAEPSSADGAPTSTSPFAPRYRAVTLGMVTLIALTAFEALAVTTTMPAVADALGGLQLYAMAFAAPVASNVVGLVAAGGWADRRGPTPPVLTGVALFATGLVIAGTATGMEVLVAGRVVQGLGAGMLMVALYVVVARLYPDAVQPRVFSAFAAAWVLPALVGPALAGLITDHLGWRWVFLAVPLLAVPALLSMRPALARTRGPIEGTVHGDAHRRAERTRLVRAVGAATGALLLHWAGQQEAAGAGVGLVVGLGLLAVTVPGLLPRGFFRARRGLPSVIMMRGVIAAAFFSAEVYLPLMLTEERGLRAAQAGLALTVAAVTWSGGSWLRGRSEGRWDDRTTLRLGALLVVLGIGFVALALVEAVPVAVSIGGWGLAGFGMGLSYPTTSLLTLRLSSPGEQGVNSSALQVDEQLSVAVLLAVCGPLFTALIDRGPTTAYLACFAIAASSALVGVVAGGRVVPRD